MSSSEVPRSLGGYVGVFRPTLLTILGVILYLRTGWVVGHGGLLGAVGVVLLTFVITGATALAFSSLATNVRLGGGGAFFLISRSLGLEVGGAVGIPLYLAQALSVAFYMQGLAEAWGYLFPQHSRGLVLLVIYVSGFGASLWSERLVLRSQFIVLIGVVAAIASMWGGWTQGTVAPTLVGPLQEHGFWELFSVFFPAGTGIMVGASLSGKLRDPRSSIPRGIMGAWAVALGVYLVTVVWFATTAPMDALRDDQFVVVSHAIYGPVVLVGLISSCASAALGSIAAAPNVLQALAVHRLVPGSRWLRRVSGGGTPRYSVALTGAIAGLALLLADLDGVARVITVFFLLSYTTINVVVAIEQALGMISFRPSLKISILVPLVGAAGSAAVLVQSEPALGLASLVLVAVVYGVLTRRELENPIETVRSGLVVALAHWAAAAAQRTTEPQYRAWKPDLLVPLTEASQLDGEARLLGALAGKKGSVQVFAVVSQTDKSKIAPRLDRAVEDFRREGLLATHVEMAVPSVIDAVRTGAAALAPTLLRPNILFINTRGRTDEELLELTRVAESTRMGLAILHPHGESGLGREAEVLVWIHPQQGGLATAVGRSNIDLQLLFAYQLERNWGALVTLCTIAPKGGEDEAHALLLDLLREARLPSTVQTKVIVGVLAEVLTDPPLADLHLVGLPRPLSRSALDNFVDAMGASCLFVADSGEESAFA